MKQLHRKHYWLGRLLASDPGYIRLHKAARATVSLMVSIFTTLFILHTTGKPLLTPAIVSGMIGMMGIMVVVDETKKEMKVTTLWLGVSAMIGVTLGSLFANHAYYIDVLLVLIVFSTFYFTRFGVRYFSLFMIGFMTVYFSSVLKLSSVQLPWFYMGIAIGIFYAYVLNFILFQSTAKNLKRSIRSFHIQSNLTLNLLIKGVQDKGLNQKQRKNIQKNVMKLREYAIIVSGYINSDDVQKTWPGLTPVQLRLYVFDTGMLIETLTDSIRGLKNADALEIDEIRYLLIWVTESLRDAEVLAPNYEEQNLEEAERAVQKLRQLIMDLLNRDQQPKGWVFLIRRIESIANHVIEGAVTIQQSLHRKYIEGNVSEVTEEPNDDEGDNEEKGLKPSTKKAYQALVTGVLAIIIGQFISPSKPYWILLTAFVVLLGTDSIGRIYTRGFQRSLGTIIGAVLGFTLAKLLTGQSFIEVIFIFVVVFLAFYLLTVSYTLMNVFITMLIAFMYDILLGGITFSLIGARVLDTIIGAAIALGVSTFVFPKKTKDKVSESINDFFDELKPFVTEYIRGFREDVNIKELSECAFHLDQKLQSIRDESQSLFQRPGSATHADITRWMTVLAAINYYARHLVASSYRKGFDYPEELTAVFEKMEEKVSRNIDSLNDLIKRTEIKATIYSLNHEREQIERLAPTRKESQRDLVHHLYYVWRINESIIELALELGAVEGE
ncbi:FUSC family protein [Bacillus sp. NEB1478]|uniref:FUSC family protein n=1 Tax=Bacillus sp. NEB1478 TaxID=3073816 RepID=UPI002873BFEA|nr:FUSC family protein [Bacillus sp. NEB1478]WNB90855.1 FUSC family protein [Bacillus sp. NEB1478]